MIIKDKMLKPYHVKYNDGMNYTVIETKKRGEKSKNPGEIYEFDVGYFRSMKQALNCILEEKLSRKNKTVDLNKYLQELEKFLADLNLVLENFRGEVK